MFGKGLGQALRKGGISCGLYLLRAALPVCRRQRPLGRQAEGRGELALPLTPWPTLSFPFSCDGGRATPSPMLFALAIHNA